MATNLELVPAAPAKRLGAAVLDWLAPVAILSVAFVVGFSGITRRQSGAVIVYDTSSVVLFGGIGLGLALVYAFVLLGGEARSGSTIGNRVMGIRSADTDGDAPGAARIFVRGIITGAGVVLAGIAAVVVVIFRWFDAALVILGPLALLAAIWAVLVVVSNSWDRNGQRQGWHDSIAKTLVFDISAGRNPVTTGGIQGPYSFAPLDLPPVQQVASPVAGASAAALAAPPGRDVPVSALAGSAPHMGTPAVMGPQVLPGAPAREHSAQAAAVFTAHHPDDDLDATRTRGSAGGPATPAPAAVLRIKLDDGRDFQLDQSVLLGRNPVAQGGERQAMLLAVADPGRSISKTHLHLLTDGAGVWVTDRNSTNGSAIGTPDGVRIPLQPGVPSFVSPGSTVHFGDRSFLLGQA
ncbi:RDD family protein [Pseudarthrobacter sp. PS3-L1]|nr:RDD family protein [Pseudarthrobacter sp. PS3-L1]MDJ0319706.1 RDD family protein [Pseudarthrobacter sp. PS3-L1]